MSTINSVLSYPDRGPWGKSTWRGNCSGHVYRDLLTGFGPVSLFVDPMMGSGTSIDVARELGIRAVGLDLHSGFSILRDPILQALGGEQADMVVSHPPYGGMVIYSGNVWGKEAHSDDLSRCKDDEEFLDKMQIALLNQREATRDSGIYGTIIGDYRKNGRYSSYQANLIARMPASELMSVLIKIQHNCTSNRRQYNSAFTLPRINHEYILLWRKPALARCLMATLTEMAVQGQRQIRSAWLGVVRNALMNLGGRAPLKDLYAAVQPVAKEAFPNNANVEAKVRQVVQTYRAHFTSEGNGVWALAA